MLMTPNQPQAKSITPQGEELLKLLRDAKGWHTRTELATLAGKSRLNKWDIALLELLEKQGLVESRKRPHPGAIGFLIEHRAKSEE